MVASHGGNLTVASVVVSLYPAFTVLLAALLLREHVHRAQSLGLAMCAVSVALVAAG
jgi:drug/metabolite transporter (DMT)-like permease